MSNIKINSNRTVRSTFDPILGYVGHAFFSPNLIKIGWMSSTMACSFKFVEYTTTTHKKMFAMVVYKLDPI